MKDPDNKKQMSILLDLLEANHSEDGLPLDCVRQHLSQSFGDLAAADAAIQRAIRSCMVEPVLDFSKDEPCAMNHIWYLRRLDEKERRRMKITCRACKALLRMLWSTRDTENLGLIRVEEAKRNLRATGLREEEIESVGGEITDRVEMVARESEPGTGKPVFWYRLIPEYERHPSQEYSEALRESDKQFMEKEALAEQLLEEDEEELGRTKKHEVRRQRTRPGNPQGANR